MKILDGHAPGSLEWRRKITATKACAILAPHLDYTTFGSPLSVWVDIMAALRGEPRDDEENAFMLWGRETEGNNRELISRELGVHVSQSPGMVQDEEFDWLASTPDGIIEMSKYKGIPDTDGVWEGKSPIYKRADWEVTDSTGAVVCPLYVLVQIHVNMRCTGLEWGVGSAFIPPRKADDKILVYGRVDRSDGFIENMVEVLQRFWEHNVLGDHAPDATGSEFDGKYLAKAFSDHREGSVELSGEICKLIPREQRLKALIPRLTRQREGITNRIVQAIGTERFGVGAGVVYDWNKQVSEYKAQPATTRTTRVLRSKKEK